MKPVTEPLIELRDLRKTFGRQTVLDGLSLTLQPGERLALIGQNGAGKTTLIRCLLGEYTSSGHIRVCGQAPRGNRVGVLRHLGYVPQLPPPLQLSVGELLRLVVGLNPGLSSQAVHHVAAELGLDLHAVRAQVFARLSGGMKQKVLIALALAKEAPLLVLDEPAANLDPDGRAAFFRLLATAAPHTGMVLISHRTDELTGLITRVVEMDLGRLVRDQRMDDGALAPQGGTAASTAQPAATRPGGGPQPLPRPALGTAFGD